MCVFVCLPGVPLPPFWPNSGVPRLQSRGRGLAGWNENPSFIKMHEILCKRRHASLYEFTHTNKSSESSDTTEVIMSDWCDTVLYSNCNKKNKDGPLFLRHVDLWGGGEVPSSCPTFCRTQRGSVAGPEMPTEENYIQIYLVTILKGILKKTQTNLYMFRAPLQSTLSKRWSKKPLSNLLYVMEMFPKIYNVAATADEPILLEKGSIWCGLSQMLKYGLGLPWKGLSLMWITF